MGLATNTTTGTQNQNRSGHTIFDYLNPGFLNQQYGNNADRAYQNQRERNLLFGGAGYGYTPGHGTSVGAQRNKITLDNNPLSAGHHYLPPNALNKQQANKQPVNQDTGPHLPADNNNEPPGTTPPGTTPPGTTPPGTTPPPIGPPAADDTSFGVHKPPKFVNNRSDGGGGPRDDSGDLPNPSSSGTIGGPPAAGATGGGGTVIGGPGGAVPPGGVPTTQPTTGSAPQWDPVMGEWFDPATGKIVPAPAGASTGADHGPNVDHSHDTPPQGQGIGYNVTPGDEYQYTHGEQTGEPTGGVYGYLMDLLNSGGYSDAEKNAIIQQGALSTRTAADAQRDALNRHLSTTGNAAGYYGAQGQLGGATAAALGNQARQNEIDFAREQERRHELGGSGMQALLAGLDAEGNSIASQGNSLAALRAGETDSGNTNGTHSSATYNPDAQAGSLANFAKSLLDKLTGGGAPKSPVGADGKTTQPVKVKKPDGTYQTLPVGTNWSEWVTAHPDMSTAYDEDNQVFQQNEDGSFADNNFDFGSLDPGNVDVSSNFGFDSQTIQDILDSWGADAGGGFDYFNYY